MLEDYKGLEMFSDQLPENHKLLKVCMLFFIKKFTYRRS